MGAWKFIRNAAIVTLYMALVIASLALATSALVRCTINVDPPVYVQNPSVTIVVDVDAGVDPCSVCLDLCAPLPLPAYSTCVDGCLARACASKDAGPGDAAPADARAE